MCMYIYSMVYNENMRSVCHKEMKKIRQDATKRQRITDNCIIDSCNHAFHKQPLHI